MTSARSQRLRSRVRTGPALVTAVLAVSLGCPGCSDTAEPADPGPVALSGTVPWEGMKWLGTVGTRVPDTLEVRAVDTTSAPVPGVPVAWATDGGSVQPLGAVTDAEGATRAVWTVGEEPGEQAVEVTSTSSDDTLRFHAIVTPPPPDDWTEVLAMALDAEPAQIDADTASAVTATLTVTNSWTGIVRLESRSSCLATARVYDEGGDEVVVLPYGCWATTGYHEVPPGGALERSWTADVSLGPGDYTVRALLQLFAVNGESLSLPDPEAALTVR